jgi:poly-beta-1,6-N-acetyl-D-glucosamine synthase
MEPRVLIVSPVRNEATHIERVVRAVAAQELPPARWVVIDDTSVDDTLARLRALAPDVPFMRVLEAPPDAPHASTRDRLARAAAPRNFNAGLATVDWREYTHIMKLDGDIELPPGYLRIVLQRFASDPRLGLAGGIWAEPRPDGHLRPIVTPRSHVPGSLKMYSQECFDAIGGLQERLGWDTIDETYARMTGFRTASFPDLVAVHHREWGSADGIVRGHARHGQCAYISHYPPLWVTLRSLKVAASRPRGLSGAAFLFGYVRAALRHTEQVPDLAYRRFTRRELRHRMLRAVVAPRRGLT